MERYMVTVCVVSFNQEKYIEECIRSICEQITDFEFKVVVHDDRSTDKTPEILHRLASEYKNISLNLRAENVGPFVNYVEAHNDAETDFVCHCDGDDIWLPNKLQKQFDFLSENIDYTVCWTNALYFNDKGEHSDPDRKTTYFFGSDNIVTFEKASQIMAVAMHSSIMYRRVARKTRDTSKLRMDIFYTLELLVSGNGKILKENLIKYRVNSVGAITKNSGTKLKKIALQNTRFFCDNYPIFKSSFFVCYMVNFIVDLKNRRDTSWLFLKAAFSCLSLNGFVKFVQFLPYIKDFRTPVLVKKDV